MKSEKRRGTAGPTIEQVNQLFASMLNDTEADTRETAPVTVLFCMGLRASELCGLDLVDVNLDRGHAPVLGKGKREKE